MYFPENVILIDCETTDQSAGPQEVVEIAGVRINRSLKIEDKQAWLVKPVNMENFTDFSEQLTGIRKRQLQNANSWDSVSKEFAKFTKHTRYRLAAWNASLDINFIKTSYRLHNLKYIHHRTPLCIMSYVIGILTERGEHLSSFGLKNLCIKYGVKIPTHRALEDVEAMLELLQKLMYDSKDREPFQLIEL